MPDGTDKEVATLSIKRPVPKGQFVQIYPAALAVAMERRQGPRRLLDALMRAYAQDKSAWGDRLYFNYKIAKDNGYPNKQSAFHKAINHLAHVGFIAPIKDQESWYFVRPLFFFKGDYVKLVDMYINGESEK